jgi:hypothetical protein
LPHPPRLNPHLRAHHTARVRASIQKLPAEGLAQANKKEGERKIIRRKEWREWNRNNYGIYMKIFIIKILYSHN